MLAEPFMTPTSIFSLAGEPLVPQQLHVIAPKAVYGLSRQDRFRRNEIYITTHE